MNATVQLLDTRGLDPTRPFPRSLKPGQLERSGRGDRRSCAELWADWRERPARPLRITARLCTPISLALGEVIHLDGALSAAVLNRPDAPPTMPAPPLGDCFFPLPLGLAWLSPQGWPLWACSDLVPVEAPQWSVIYVHRRYPAHREPLQRERGAITYGGRWKDTRIPHRVAVVERLSATAFGDAEALSGLLEGLTHLGKKPAHGRGRVMAWEVAPEPGLQLADVLARRPTPWAALGAGEPPPGARRRGWTPAYWDVAKHAAVRESAHG